MHTSQLPFRLLTKLGGKALARTEQMFIFLSALYHRLHQGNVRLRLQVKSFDSKLTCETISLRRQSQGVRDRYRKAGCIALYYGEFVWWIRFAGSLRIRICKCVLHAGESTCHAPLCQPQVVSIQLCSKLKSSFVSPFGKQIWPNV